jgi:hypothetical protein
VAGEEVARIFSVQSANVFLAKAMANNAATKKFSFVGFSSGSDEPGGWIWGLVIESYQLNEQQWLRILTDPVFKAVQPTGPLPNRPKKGFVYSVPVGQFDVVNRLVGTVYEGTRIEKLKFDYAFKVSVQEGELLEVACNDVPVLYQVVEGTTGTEILESKDEAGLIVGEAVQLGVWNSESRSFNRFGWVPTMNSPVFKARPIEPVQPLENEFQVGSIPGTNFPVFIDKVAAVTHHLAILGVTGSGKSVFARNLLRQISSPDTKIICLDFTNEYKSRLADLVVGSLVTGAAATDMFAAIDAIGEELDKFANQRNKAVIAQKESVLREGFKAALKTFVNSESRATLFELPDVTNSAGILEYTKWFFKSLFELARANELGGKRVCIVLEEAHTIVPEWNFLGTEDKRSTSVVNSISQIALQGRKYGVGFIVIAQRTANVSKTVLTQCNSVIAFQQFDKTSADFLGNYMGADFVSALTRLRPRHAIAVGKAFSGGTPIIFEVPDIVENNP